MLYLFYVILSIWEWKTFHVRCCMEDIGVKHHFIEKDGIRKVPLPFDFNETL